MKRISKWAVGMPNIGSVNTGNSYTQDSDHSKYNYVGFWRNILDIANTSVTTKTYPLCITNKGMFDAIFESREDVLMVIVALKDALRLRRELKYQEQNLDTRRLGDRMKMAITRTQLGNVAVPPRLLAQITDDEAVAAIKRLKQMMAKADYISEFGDEAKCPMETIADYLGFVVSLENMVDHLKTTKV